MTKILLNKLLTRTAAEAQGINKSENKMSDSLCKCADRFEYLGLNYAHGLRSVFMRQGICILLYTRCLIQSEPE